MFNCSNYNYLIFDCDGVILDSNSLKSKAFSYVLPEEPSDLVNTFADYHKQHDSISRYKRFQHYCTVTQTCLNAENKISEALLRFASFAQKGFLGCD